MIRSIKALGHALFAIATFGAFAGGSAHAAAGEAHITTAEETAVVTGDGTNGVVRFGTSELKCGTVQFEGTGEVQANPQTPVTQNGTQLTGNHIVGTPRFEKCQFLGVSAQINMSGCKYTLTGTAELTAQARLVACTTGKQIEVVAAGGICTITVGKQPELGHVIATNDAESETTKHHVQDHSTVSGIKYTRDGAFCPQGEMSYSGTTTIKAYKDLGTRLVQDPITNHQYAEHLCGEEVGSLAT